MLYTVVWCADIFRYFVAVRRIPFEEEALLRFSAACERSLSRIVTRFVRLEATAEGLAMEGTLGAMNEAFDAQDVE
jgi:hypothetical protein